MRTALRALLLLLCTAVPAFAQMTPGVFLFVTFHGESTPMTEPELRRAAEVTVEPGR